MDKDWDTYKIIHIFSQLLVCKGCKIINSFLIIHDLHYFVHRHYARYPNTTNCSNAVNKEKFRKTVWRQQFRVNVNTAKTEYSFIKLYILFCTDKQNLYSTMFIGITKELHIQCKDPLLFVRISGMDIASEIYQIYYSNNFFLQNHCHFIAYAWFWHWFVLACNTCMHNYSMVLVFYFHFAMISTLIND